MEIKLLGINKRFGNDKSFLLISKPFPKKSFFLLNLKDDNFSHVCLNVHSCVHEGSIDRKGGLDKGRKLVQKRKSHSLGKSSKNKNNTN